MDIGQTRTQFWALPQLVMPSSPVLYLGLIFVSVYHSDMNTLFDSTFSTDDGELENVLADRAVKDFLEELWKKYSPYAVEKSFRGDLKAQPHARIWEMYLANALIDCGFDLARKQEKGPDIQLKNPTIWIEAVASTDGSKSNDKGTQSLSAIPEILLPESMCGGPPEIEIILRYTGSIKDKLTKLLKYLEKGPVDQNEPYIVALNSHKVSHAQYDHQHTPNKIPTIVKAVFGYGDSVRRSPYPKNGFSPPIDSKSTEYKYRPYITNHSGVEISTGMFFSEDYSSISALIFSKEGFWSLQNRIPDLLSENFILIHNPLAKNPLPKKWLKSGHEFWIDQGGLYRSIWRNGNEYSLEKFPLPYDLPSEIKPKLHNITEYPNS